MIALVVGSGLVGSVLAGLFVAAMLRSIKSTPAARLASARVQVYKLELAARAARAAKEIAS